MVIVRTPGFTRLALTFQEGTDAAGKPILYTRSISNVRSEAADDAVYQVAQWIASLSTDLLVDIQRVDQAVLAESGS
ncbi:MAG: DUF1659 domain-containing protein [Firmicutes bacterium]|nr:DUF1659 domain-containing protein [Bacillota bacterium]